MHLQLERYRSGFLELQLDDFLTLQDQLPEYVVSSDGLDLRRLRLPSLAFPMFEATAASEKRHLN